jgi:ribosomal protein L11 methyltransferase
VSRPGALRYVWRKLASAKWEEAWLERLAFVRERLAVTVPDGHRMMRLEVYGLTRADGGRLQRAFGGALRIQGTPTCPAAHVVRRPICIRSKLRIVCAPTKRPSHNPRSTTRARTLFIPAGMAFGTGDHVTTATCLRLLADLSDQWKDRTWDMLDLGTGTGILAIAARAFGARRAQACDFDPDAVRVARDNIRRNAIDRVAAVRLDVRQWKPTRQWHVVTANLYSELLIEVAPKIARAVEEGGRFIFSGVLRRQEKEVLRALRLARFKMLRVVRRGKWVAGLAAR